jgi:hypothetical protein
MKAKRYPYSGMAIEPLEDGKIRFEYGGSLGSKTFVNNVTFCAEMETWMQTRARLLRKQIEELEQLSRDIWKY